MRFYDFKARKMNGQEVKMDKTNSVISSTTKNKKIGRASCRERV